MAWRSCGPAAFGIGGVTPTRAAVEYSQTVRNLAQACERLIASSRAGQAVPVLRKAADRITSAQMYMDDSSGIVGDDLHGIMGLYARACAAAPPNPTGLAGQLPRDRDDHQLLGVLAGLQAMAGSRSQVRPPLSWVFSRIAPSFLRRSDRGADVAWDGTRRRRGGGGVAAARTARHVQVRHP
jgi:hypothetical protein